MDFVKLCECVWTVEGCMFVCVCVSKCVCACVSVCYYVYCMRHVSICVLRTIIKGRKYERVMKSFLLRGSAYFKAEVVTLPFFSRNQPSWLFLNI